MSEEAAKEESKPAATEVEENKEPAKVESGDDAGDDIDEPKEEPIYQEQLPNRVIVARNHPLSYYVDRARRILRMEDKLFVSGRGNTISMACTLVEVLKRQKIAVVESISTGMNVEPFFNAAGDPRWSSPTSMITFNLGRGEFAEFVADYHQRKVIEIFENTDEKDDGSLSFDKIESMDFVTHFKANDDQQQKAKEFLSSQEEKKLDLPTFIKYASILIHPLLKDKVFKQVLSKEFGIAAQDGRNQNVSNQ
eukprot:471585_1